MKCLPHKRSLLVFLFLAGIFSQTEAQTNPSLKFSVDMGMVIDAGKFNPQTDRVLLRGNFNSWGTQDIMTRENTSSIYSISLTIAPNNYYDYKFFITTQGAQNNGWEENIGVGSNGSRKLFVGTNSLVLPVVFFNNGDIALHLTTEHFRFFCTFQDTSLLGQFSEELESEYERIVNALDVTIGEITNVTLFKDLDAFHNFLGYPEWPEWAVGSAMGKSNIYMASPNHAGSTSYDAMLTTIIHEFVHIAEHWKTKTDLPTWLNEGVAVYLAGQSTTRENLRYLIDRLGRIPDLEFFENSGTSFGDNGGYSFSYTIVEFIVQYHGMEKLAAFLEQVSYPVLGFANKAEFQKGWHTYLINYYVNTPPPAITIGTIRRYGESWFINYNPHTPRDQDGDDLTYFITLVSADTSLEFSDTGHSGSFIIPRATLGNDKEYTVSAASFDGKIYTNSRSTKTFSTRNQPPEAFTFTGISDGMTLVFDENQGFTFYWSPLAERDIEGDSIMDLIRISGQDYFNQTSLPGTAGQIRLDSAELLPGREFTLVGLRSDGMDTVHCDSIGFHTPGADGIRDFSDSARMDVYPSPFQTRLHIKISNAGVSSGKLEVYNATGERVWEKPIGNRLIIEENPDFANLPPGIYYLVVTTAGSDGKTGRMVRKMIKQGSL
jgi:hypothetical protein